MQSRLAQGVTYRCNVVYDRSNAIKNFHEVQKAKLDTDKTPMMQEWDIQEGELLFNTNNGTSTSAHSDRSRMTCLSNTNGMDTKTDFKFVGIALGPQTHNDRMMPQGIAAAREGTFTVIYNGVDAIQPGQTVCAYIENDLNTAASCVRGLPNNKKLLMLTAKPEQHYTYTDAFGASQTITKSNAVRIGMALSHASRSGERLDILLC
jgi:hypothetical protein